MKKFSADLHIHTMLSPCADMGMTPDSIIKKAQEAGLDIIAITDHNSVLHCEVVRKLAEGSGLIVLNGCEVNSKEEVHALCFFEDDYSRGEFQKYLNKHLPQMPNIPEYYGLQVQVDENNNVIQELPYYLGNALDVGVEEIASYVHELNGLFVPAHIDRQINSIYSQLGYIPTEMNVDGLQISTHVRESKVRRLYDIHKEISVIKASDAHYLEDIGASSSIFNLNEPTFQEIKWAFQQKNGRSIKIEK